MAAMLAETAEDSATGASRVGSELRAARQRLGWALPDVAAMLRIRLPYLEAIEDGRVADLPSSTYAIGFLRTYATALGLDADEMARRFRAEAGEVRKPELAFPVPVPERGVPAGAVVLLGAVLVALAYGGWYKLSGEHRAAADAVTPVPARLAPLAANVEPTPSPQVASVMPAGPPPIVNPTPPLTAAPSPATPPPAPDPAPTPVAATVTGAPPPAAQIVLRAKADSWVQVRDKQGKVVFFGIMRPGETWTVPDGAPLLLTTGNAGGTEIDVGGQPAPPLGKSGAVLHDVPLDADALKQGRFAAAARVPTSTPRPAPQ